MTALKQKIRNYVTETNKKTIALYLEDIETPIGKAINFILLFLILFYSAIFVAETYPIPEQLFINLELIDDAILVCFAVEYILRFWCAEKKIKFVFSFFSIVDLLAILPIFPEFLELSFIRLIRWFRILRLIRFLKFKIYIFRISTEDGVILARILFTLFTIIFIFSGLIYQVEHRVNPESFNTFLDAVYFSVVTMTTVGFGDVIPTSESGRLLTVLMILTGISLIPSQLGDFIKHLIKTAKKREKLCSGCGFSTHDIDAKFCKICGTELGIYQINNVNERK
ncbi:MAG: ion transporter [Okeania sp. SIO2C9]|uniref:ion transporter n=1 Tax=Okeania sp. SIO2C9 TaxID=2607791 RepID=UPI0013C22F8A|nr:ion transporter [Okeania sp. SIO2C9]NEQ75582.1 ion transporter [Okeania sp. SIO2C9]